MAQLHYGITFSVSIAHVSDRRNCGATATGPKVGGLPHSVRHRWHWAGHGVVPVGHVGWYTGNTPVASNPGHCLVFGQRRVSAAYWFVGPGWNFDSGRRLNR